MSTKLDHIPIADVMDVGENPRSKADAGSMRELVESVRQHGILQPVLVETDGGGKYRIIAGHRRLAAAKKAGLDRVPAQIAAKLENRLVPALTENILREDLSPVEEALALARLDEELGFPGVRELARRLGKGKDWISDRLRLARLPEPIHARVAAGDTGLREVPQLAAIADKFGADVATAVALYVGQAESRWLKLDTATDAAAALASAIQHGKARGIVLAASGHRYGTSCGVKQLGLDAKVEKELAAELRALGGTVPGQYGDVRPQFSFDAAAAGKAGVLIKFGGHSFITDKPWLERQARTQLATWRTAKEKAPKQSAGGAKQDEARRQGEAEKKRVRAGELRQANLELGRKLADKFATAELTADVARLLVRYVVYDDFEFGEQIAFVDERLQEVDEQGNVEYQPEKFEKLLEEELASAAGPGEILALLVRLIIAHALAVNPDYPAARPWTASEDADELVDAIARRARVVPKVLKEARAKT